MSDMAAQEASSRLYLCVLLRSKPLLAEAVITGLNGSRFLDVYVPEIGVELRINVNEIVPGPVRADWDPQAKCAPCCTYLYACPYKHMLAGTHSQAHTNTSTE